MDSLFSAVRFHPIKMTSILYWGCLNFLLRSEDLTTTAITIRSPSSLSISRSSATSSIHTKDTKVKRTLYLQTMGLLQPFIGHSLLIFITTLLVYQVTLVVYRLYFSPLAKFPGPKLAAASLWYEFYYDVWCDGQFTFKIRELHKVYGPIIRISPHQLHVYDPAFYEELYSQHKVRHKYSYFLDRFQLPGSAFGSVDHKLHRERRAALNKYLSKQTIKKLEPMLLDMLDKLCGRIEEFREKGEELDMRIVYQCFITDVITLYALNRSWNHLDSPNFSPLWVETIAETVKLGHLLTQFPILLPISLGLPRWFLKITKPGFAMLMDFRKAIEVDTRNILDGNYKFDPDKGNGIEGTIVHAILESDEIPPSEKEFQRLFEEAFTLIGAGSDTVSNMLTNTHFHLLDNPQHLKTLRGELKSVMQDRYARACLKDLEGLPFLNAVTNEGLRLSYGISTRLPRISPYEVMMYKDWEIPAGTPVSMTSVHMHQNPDIFPDPLTFNPYRWLTSTPAPTNNSSTTPPLHNLTPDKTLEKYLVAFGKGSRSCAGINLARAEILLTLATIFRRYEAQELVETDRRDVEVKRDLFLPFPEVGRGGVRVRYG
ncbi:uncharacterized protein EAE97_000015 [Botrytis byssoidea]|uniref:Cytochrome P450 n=1 Tax=Botrytis byssoidea TaxID=139641 RepID=A0A9P5IYK8_9HELO|nr:uncharacterized protein EAE97_000015 [Botrytis byssoidea]KAF7954756.1 hypothetical protein EAE97_000015 [Botrytis byssoidea]